MADQLIELTVNNRLVQVPAEQAGWSLTRFLRMGLGLTGVKQSCDGDGTCGSCTVIVDGQIRRSCKLFMENLSGAVVQTIEGFRDMPGGIPHPLLQTVVQDGIFQCGYCASGALLTAKALLDRNPNPDPEEVVNSLSGVACRCAGLYRLDQAVLRAAAILRGDLPSTWTPDDTLNERLTLEKLTGVRKYTDDLSFPGMLFARAKRSPLPHARVLKVDTSRAEALPGVIRVLTAADVPGRNRFGLLVRDQPIFCDEVVRYVGDCLALVVAETPDAAQAALDAVIVELDPLPVLDTPERALAPDAPVLHPYLAEENPGEHPNVLKHHAVRKGDVEQGFREADIILEGEYRTPFIDHAYMELECSIGVPEADGTITVYVGSQGPVNDREQVSEALGVPLEEVRIAHQYVGGGFGGKEDVTGQVLAAVAARVTGRPVKILFTREESLTVHHKRHAMTMTYKVGATRDGRVVAAEVKVIGDTGAYASTGEAVLFRSSTFACGPYVIPNVKVDAYAVHTNNPTCGAFRGFGGTQVAYAGEVHLQKVIDALGLNAFDFRLKNALRLGDATVTGHVLDELVGADYAKCLQAVKDAMTQEPLPELGPDEKVGIGVAGAYKNVGLGSGIPDGAGAAISLEKDGTFLVRHGAADIGQGSNDVMAIVTSRTLGVPLKDIFIHTGDTRLDPLGGMTTASRATFVSGNATLLAAQSLRGQLWKYVAGEFNVPEADLSIEDGAFVSRTGGRRLISLVDLANNGETFAARSQYDAPQTNRVPAHADCWPTPQTSDHRLHFAYDFGAQAAMVIVNTRTGAVKVHKIVAAHDVGKAISLRNTIGQLEGATVQGLGFALSEGYQVKDGYPQTVRFNDIGMQRLKDLPEIEAILIEEPHPLGPMGAKGMGELAISPTAPAVVNAIHDAVGVWVESLPVSPEKILAGLASKTGQA